VVGATIVTAAAVGWFAYFTAAKELQAAAASELVALRGSRHAAIDQYFKSIEEDLELLASSPQVIDALGDFTRVFGGFDQANRWSIEKLMRQIYTPDRTKGSRDKLRKAAMPSIDTYFGVHLDYHPWFNLALKLRGYYDLFLITPRGDVVYTVFKEPDFASNILTGTWRDTGLAKVFRHTIDGFDDSGHVFVDFTAYEPSNGAPAAFIARKIVHLDRPIGVLVLQMPIDRISEVMQVTAGMGETGETYLVGPDRLMRSDSRFSEKSTILNQRVTGATVDAALAAETGVAVVDDYRGMPVLSAYQPYNFRGTRWAILAEKDMAEILAPVQNMRNTLVIISILLTLVVAAGGLLVSLSITRPLAAIRDAFVQFGETRQTANLRDLDRGDEIGDMSRAFKELTGDITTYITERKEAEAELARKQAQLRVAMDNMPGAMFVVDENLDLVLVNEQYAELYGHPDGLMVEGASMKDVLHYEMEQGILVGKGEPEEILKERLQSYGKTETVSFEDRTPDGRFAQVTRNPAPGGHVVTVVTDITERKNAEKIIADAMTLIHESIQYASRIQRSVLPDPKILEDVFADHAVIWEPKDLVGGDIYQYRSCRGRHLLMLVDCTGHGVPGAFMTMIATGALDQALIEVPGGDPAAVLQRVNQLVKTVLSQDKGDGESDDGLECGLCLIDDDAGEITFAGARFEFWCVNGEDLTVIKSDKTGIGYRRTPMDQAFTNHVVSIDKGARYFMASDGLVDQIGGAKRRAFGKRRIKELILQGGGESMAKQGQAIFNAFIKYQGVEERRDDISFIGFKPR